MKYILAIAAFSLMVMGCPAKPKPVVDEPAQEPTVEETSGASESEVKAAELEKKRKSVEDMINDIMTEDVYFDFDKHLLSEKARDVLARIGDILIEEKQFSVVIEGHTDDVGTETYNMSLGGKRARAVYKFLSDYGVESKRLTTMSYGEEQPKVEGETDKDRELNRRAHFKVEIIK